MLFGATIVNAIAESFLSVIVISLSELLVIVAPSWKLSANDKFLTLFSLITTFLTLAASYLDLTRGLIFSRVKVSKLPTRYTLVALVVSSSTYS